jgi:HEPN domain-containing protein
MVDSELMKQWFDLSEKDFAVAEHVAHNMHPVPHEIICFHCQQSAEKDLKGFMIRYDKEPPKIHDLVELLKTCESINSQFSTLLNKCVFLNRYSVIPRYPNELQITDDDVKICLRYTRDIKEFVKGLLVDDDVMAS